MTELVGNQDFIFDKSLDYMLKTQIKVGSSMGKCNCIFTLQEHIKRWAQKETNIPVWKVFHQALFAGYGTSQSTFHFL